MNPIPVDILVQEAKKDFVTWSVNLIMTSIVTAMGPTSIVLSWALSALRFFLTMAVTALVNWGELGAFILNAKILTSAEASDYREAVLKRIMAKDDIPDKDWEEIEREANSKLIQLVRFSV